MWEIRKYFHRQRGVEGTSMFKVLTCLFPTCPRADLSSPKNMIYVLVERLPQEHRVFLSRKVSEQQLMLCPGRAGSHYRVGVRKHVRPLAGLAVGAWAQTRLCPNWVVPHSVTTPSWDFVSPLGLRKG